jgi:hypothetical protein
METQTMVEAVGFFFWFIKKSIIDKILAVRLEGFFWARNKEGFSFGVGVWAWPLEASHYGCPSRSRGCGIEWPNFDLHIRHYKLYIV